jgi:hypothetical protein
MPIFIVLKNGKVDEVFSNRAAAEAHAKALNKRWNTTEILEKEVWNI